MTFERKIDTKGSLGQQSGAVEFSNELEERLMKSLGRVATRTNTVEFRRPKSDKGV